MAPESQACAGGWTVWVDRSPRPPGVKVAGEETLLEGVAGGRLGPVLRLWINGPALVLGRFEAWRLQRQGRLPESFGGIPVLARPSGGTAVPHGPGELNVTLCYPAGATPAAPEPGYRRLIEGLQEAVGRALGLEATEGAVPGSFCDGRFNLVVGGRKVAGTAQAQRRGAVLVHGTLMVSGRGADRLRVVADFCGSVGEAGLWLPDSVASLSELSGRDLAPDDLVVPMIEAFCRMGPPGRQVPLDSMANR